MHDWVATRVAVKRKGVIAEDICNRCGLEQELKEHIFFHCSESILTWKLSPVKWTEHNHLTGSLEAWWMAISSTSRNEDARKEVAFTAYLLWAMLKARNQWQFQEYKWQLMRLFTKHYMNGWNTQIV